MSNRVIIIYDTKTGNTELMARFIAEGLRGEGIEPDVIKASAVQVESLREYDGIIIGSPAYFGLPSAHIKKLLDESISIFKKLDGKVGGAFCSSGNIGGGNETTINALLNALFIHGMIVQGNSKGAHYGPVSIRRPDERVEKECVDYGSRCALLVKKIFPRQQ